MSYFKPQRLTIALLLGISSPLLANSQAAMPFQANPAYAPMPVYAPAMPAQPQQAINADKPSVFVAPEYVGEVAKQNPVTTQPRSEQAASSAIEQLKEKPSLADEQPKPVEQQRPPVMPPVGAYGYADEPSVRAVPNANYPVQNQPQVPTESMGQGNFYVPVDPHYSLRDQSTAAPMGYGYAPSYPAEPYYGMPYPPTAYAPQQQWMPGQNNTPFGGLADDFLSGENPFTNPMGNNGYWASPKFRPWSSGPFSANRWGNHPMNNMPWGRFPGWGDGFFGGFGPDNWKGVTPWGNDVPFRWIDPSDPRESIASMWDDAINTPNGMGRMPPGWTAPYISVPNPVDVADEFEKNARRFPDEINNMIDFGDD